MDSPLRDSADQGASSPRRAEQEGSADERRPSEAKEEGPLSAGEAREKMSEKTSEALLREDAAEAGVFKQKNSDSRSLSKSPSSAISPKGCALVLYEEEEDRDLYEEEEDRDLYQEKEDGNLYKEEEDGNLYEEEDGILYQEKEDGNLYKEEEDGNLYKKEEDGNLYKKEEDGNLYKKEEDGNLCKTEEDGNSNKDERERDLLGGVGPREREGGSSRMSSSKLLSDEFGSSRYHSSNSAVSDDIPSKTDVVIVGAGPTGLTLALLLARQGVEFVILDSLSSPMKGSRAVALHSRSLEIFEDMGVAGSLLALGHRCRGLRLWLFGEEAGELSGEQLLNNLPAVQCIPILKSLTLLSKHIGARAPPEALEGASSIAGPFPFSITLPQSVTEQVLEMHLNELGHKVRRPVQVRQVRCLDAEEPPFYPLHSEIDEDSVVEDGRDCSGDYTDVSAVSSSGESFLSPVVAEKALSTSVLQEDSLLGPRNSESLDCCTFSVSSVDDDGSGGLLCQKTSLLGYPVTVHFAILSANRETHSVGEVRCRYVVACDGSQSDLRNHSCVGMVESDASSRTYTAADVELAGETSVETRSSLRVREDSGGAILLQAQMLEQQETLRRIMRSEDGGVRPGVEVGSDRQENICTANPCGALGILPPFGESRVRETLSNWTQQLSAVASSVAEKATSVAASAAVVAASSTGIRVYTEDRGELVSPPAFLSQSTGSFMELHFSQKGFAVCCPLTHRPAPEEVAQVCAPHRKASLASLRARRCSTGLAEVQGFHWRILVSHYDSASSLQNRVLAGTSPQFVVQSVLPELCATHSASSSPATTPLQSAKTLNLTSSRCLHLPLTRSDSGSLRRIEVMGADEKEDIVSTIEEMLPGCRVTRVFGCERYQVHCKRAKEFKYARLLLAGDAAHTLEPILASGLNLGIQDAYNLGWKLARVLRHGASTQLLWSYSEESEQAAALMPHCLTRFFAPVAMNLPGISSGFGGIISMSNVFYKQPSSILPGMRMPDCLMKVAKSPRIGALCLSNAVVGYLFELLGKGRHVLLLHLQVLPPGSRKQNMFGCEMPNAPLVPRYNSEVVSSLVRLVQLATLVAAKTPQPFQIAQLKSKASPLPSAEVWETVRSGGPFSAADFEGSPRSLDSSLHGYLPSKQTRRDSVEEGIAETAGGEARRAGSSASASSNATQRQGSPFGFSAEGSIGARSFWTSELRVLWCLHGPGTAAALHTTVTNTSITSQIVRTDTPSKLPQSQRRSLFLSRKSNFTSSPGAPTLEVQSSGEWAEDECQLVQRPVLEMLPPALVRALQQIPGGCGGFVLVDFLQDMQMKMGLRLEDPHSSLGAEASGGFSLIRPDGFLAYAGRAGDSQAARAMLDYLIKY